MLGYKYMNIRRKFTGAQKTAIVLEVLKGNNSALEISKKHQIAPSVVYGWVDHFTKNAHTVFSSKEKDTEKDKKIKHYEHIVLKLTTQNDFLDKVLATMQ